MQHGPETPDQRQLLLWLPKPEWPESERIQLLASLAPLAETFGLTLPEAGSWSARRLARRGRAGARDVYWTGRPGHANQGHDFGTDLDPLALQVAQIELPVPSTVKSVPSL